MKKIPTVFIRDPENRKRVTTEVNPECQWVLDGEGVATRKWDGTCTMLDENGRWWARREVKEGALIPPGWVRVADDVTTGKSVGWEPIEQSSFAKFHAEALDREYPPPIPGTYELIGVRINGNPEHVDSGHLLVRHGTDVVDVERSYEGIRDWCLTRSYLDGSVVWHPEGIVFWHPDGRRAKIKRRDFGGEQ